MNIIIITAMVITVIALCALALKGAKRADDQFADMNRRLKELEQNKTEVQ